MLNVTYPYLMDHDAELGSITILPDGTLTIQFERVRLVETEHGPAREKRACCRFENISAMLFEGAYVWDQGVMLGSAELYDDSGQVQWPTDGSKIPIKRALFVLNTGTTFELHATSAQLLLGEDVAEPRFPSSVGYRNDRSPT